MLYYFLIGICYAIINGLVRKIETDDMLLVFAWVILWPLFVLPLLWVIFVEKFFKKKF